MSLDPLPSARLLLLEDHADSAKVTARLLSMSGYAVVHAATCAAARAAATAERFDLMICDLGLSDGDACALLEELRGQHGLHGIVYSGTDSPDALERCHEAGFLRYLVKPVPYPTLAEAVAAALATCRR